MIDSVLNLIFSCRHRHLTRPITPAHRAGTPAPETYVVCLDCTKQFAYDVKNMRIGKPIDRAHDAYVLPARVSKPRHTGVKFALGAAVPLALLAGSLWSNKQKNSRTKNTNDSSNSNPPAA